MVMMVFLFIFILFAEFVDNFNEGVQVVGMLPVQGVDDTLLVDELVGGIAVDTDIVLDGALLVCGQVVVNTVRSRQVIL